MRNAMTPLFLAGELILGQDCTDDGSTGQPPQTQLARGTGSDIAMRSILPLMALLGAGTASVSGQLMTITDVRGGCG